MIWRFFIPLKGSHTSLFLNIILYATKSGSSKASVKALIFKSVEIRSPMQKRILGELTSQSHSRPQCSELNLISRDQSFMTLRNSRCVSCALLEIFPLPFPDMYHVLFLKSSPLPPCKQVMTLFFFNLDLSVIVFHRQRSFYTPNKPGTSERSAFRTPTTWYLPTTC